MGQQTHEKLTLVKCKGKSQWSSIIDEELEKFKFQCSVNESVSWYKFGKLSGIIQCMNYSCYVTQLIL